MSRKISTRKIHVKSLEEVHEQILDMIYREVDCKTFSFVIASDSLRQVLSTIDPKKAKYVFNINSPEVSVSAKGAEANLLIDPPRRMYNLLQGSVVILDGREDTTNFAVVMEMARRAAYFITFLPVGMSAFPVDEKRWKSLDVKVEGYNIQVLRNRTAAYAICEDNLEYAKNLLTYIQELEQKEVPPPPPPAPAPQPIREVEEAPQYTVPENFMRIPLVNKPSDLEFREGLEKLPNPLAMPRDTQGIYLSDAWMNNFTRYVRSLIKVFCPRLTDDLLEKLTSPEMMPHWVPAFVHSSVNANDGENYDQLESLGDAVLGAMFKKYLVTRDPTISESVLNERKSRYMSTEFQRLIGDKMIVQDWVVTRGQHITEAVKEDIFESFCGALQKVGDLVVRDDKKKKSTGGLGDLLVYVVVQTIFDGVRFDESYDYGSDVTIAEQLAKNWHFYLKPLYVTNGNMHTYTYYFTGERFNEYLQVMLPLVGESYQALDPWIKTQGLVGRATHPVKEKAKNMAATEIVNQLAALHITRKFIKSKDLRKEFFYSNPEYRQLVDQVVEKITAQGFSHVYINEPKTTSTLQSKLFTLVAEKLEDGKVRKEILSYGEYRRSAHATKAETFDDKVEFLRKYLQE